MDSDFALNVTSGLREAPLVLIAATDGCFGYCLSPAHFEHAVLCAMAEANDGQDELRFTVTSLADHLAQAPREGLPTWSGELRSGATANLLMGVASCRVDVKQAAARAERWLERTLRTLAHSQTASTVNAAVWVTASGKPCWRCQA